MTERDPRSALADAFQDSDERADDEQLQPLKNATILMVDDDPLAIDAIEAFLAEAGYERFVGITDSRSAVAALEERNPDALLLDLNMPEVTGFDVLERMRADRTLRHVPTIVLTSSNDAETKLRCLELGATDILAKPVDPSELVLRLRNTLAAKSYADRLTYYDALTGLPNRKRFLMRLGAEIERSPDPSRVSAVLSFDLDRFYQINDSLDWWPETVCSRTSGAVSSNACERATWSGAWTRSRSGQTSRAWVETSSRSCCPKPPTWKLRKGWRGVCSRP